jgi:hypothetical protein
VKDTDIIAAIAPDAVSLMDKAIAEIKRLRQENETLTAERNEARREVCYAEVNGQYGRRYTLQDIAKIKGWDCYKEENNNG